MDDIDNESSPQNIDFDFESYFADAKDGLLSEADFEEFPMRVVGMFCRDVFRANGDMSKVTPWVANYIAEQAFKVLGGGSWSEEIPMPWYPKVSTETRRGKRANAVYLGIERALKEDPDLLLDDLFEEMAETHCIGVKMIKLDYYALKNCILGKKPLPKWMLPQLSLKSTSKN